MAAANNGIVALFAQAKRKRGPRNVPEQVCQHCKRVFRPKKYDRLKFCSRECSFAAKTEAASQRAEIRRAEAQSAEQQRLKKAEARRLAALDAVKQRSLTLCQKCNRIVGYSGMGRSKLFCSRDCRKASDGSRNAKRISKAIRRARKLTRYVEPVDPFKVFIRDGWRCGICRTPTPRRLMGTLADTSPELDHIVPLAAGGEHSYRNTQCACRKCNQTKGARPLGQLRMFV
jgi:5-methylcytosine-specific restriction endonuclease McrA